MQIKEMDDEKVERQEQVEEDYSIGCYESNYMKPHVCPIATGEWCRDYMKCKNREEE